MNSPEYSDIMLPEDGSRLLSESPILASSLSHTGPGGDDLSISELSLPDRGTIFDKPFSLLAPPEDDLPTPTRGSLREYPNDDQEDEEGEEEEEEEGERYNEVTEQQKRHAAKAREEKLQSDIFILRKLNASFASFYEALQDTGSANQRVAAQLEQTDALLNKYIGMLSKSEEIARLIFDEEWQGVEEDENILQREYIARKEKERQEAEQRALAERREQERIEREERERLEQEERQRLEQEKKERAASRGGIRGVRGTRASMRGTARGTTRAAPTGTTVGRARSASANPVQAGPSGVQSKLPTASSTRGLSRRT